MAKIINNISVDCVVFGYAEDKMYVLLTKRELLDPDTGITLFSDFNIQGHHVLVGENVDGAAKRVLKDKTGLDSIYLKQFYAFGDTDRLLNPHDRLWSRYMTPEVGDYVLTVGYYSLVDKTKVNPDEAHSFTSWFPLDDLPELGFDHGKIIDKAMEALQSAVLKEPIAFELLPEKFTLLQVQRLYEAILGVTLDRRNFRKKINQMKYVIPLDEKQNGVPHTPAQYYIFSWDVYHKTKKEKFSISF
jgi:8-oxo-dGTP diphosphatase